MTRQSGFPNYDESTFLTPGPLSEDDTELEEIWKGEHSLKDIVDHKNFKTYDELKRRLEDVMGNATSTPAPVARKAVVEDDDVPFTDSKPVAKKAPVVQEEEDEGLAMFRALAEE